MSPRFSAPWRVATVVVVLGLLGSAIVTLSLIDGSARPAGRRAADGKLNARPGGGDLAAGAARSGRGRVPAASTGLRLLRQAATACQQVTYHGVQVVAWWGSDGPATSTVDVWHQPGRGTLAQPASTADGTPGRADPLVSPDTSPDGSLDLSGPLLDLMQVNYEVRYTGDGDADDRPAHIIEVRRPGGSLAARFWLDAATSLPLRRDMFDTSARRISEDAFVSLNVGAAGLAAMPATAASPWSGRLSRTQVAALRAESWPLPAGLPGHLALFAAEQTTGSARPVVDMSYSDGLSVVSLFVQRGTLPTSMTGWRKEKVAGHPVYAADSGGRSLAWSARGFEFTLIASAPPATVSQVVAALPRAPAAGFWPRLKRGFHRIVSWANPFR